MTTLTQVCPEEVTQSEAHRTNGPHESVILSNALSKPLHARARFILLQETSKNKKWTRKEMIPDGNMNDSDLLEGEGWYR